jgi:hypothetical protein
LGRLVREVARLDCFQTDVRLLLLLLLAPHLELLAMLHDDWHGHVLRNDFIVGKVSAHPRGQGHDMGSWNSEERTRLLKRFDAWR